MENQEIKIIFTGTPDFGAIILKGLIENKHKPVLVITNPDRPKGREQEVSPTPVKIVAQENNIPVIQPEKIIEAKEKIKEINPDVIVVAAYGGILPKEIMDLPKYGCLNVHPSLLPSYRGSTPIQTAILNGDTSTGVTIMLMDEKLDHGPIINQRGADIRRNEDAIELHYELAELGSRLLLETIPGWVKGAFKSKPQNDLKATFSKALTKENGRINWKKPAEVIEREIRAFQPWPGSYTEWERKTGEKVRLKILKSRIMKREGGIPYEIGKVLVVPQNEIGVQCGKGFFPGGGDMLVIEQIQMEGKKICNAEDFLRGYPDFAGAILK